MSKERCSTKGQVVHALKHGIFGGVVGFVGGGAASIWAGGGGAIPGMAAGIIAGGANGIKENVQTCKKR
jgi:hypothetical protein